MTYSGDKSWSMTRDMIIESALRKIGEYDSGEAVPLEEKASAALSLNAIIKELTALGAALFLRNRAVVFTKEGYRNYALSRRLNATADDTVLGPHTSIGDTADITDNSTTTVKIPQFAGNGVWDEYPFRLGAYYLWVDPADDNLYIKEGAPSSVTDGTVVGAQS